MRQLARALAVHRLYDGDTNAAAFREAAARVDASARDALASGSIAVALIAGRFVVDDEPIADEQLDRLAQVCFERRIQHLELRAPPPPDQLAAFLTAVTGDATDGVDATLARAGVTAIVVRDHTPDAAAGQDLAEHLLTLSTWTQTVGEDAIDEAPATQVTPSTDAATLYDRLSQAATSLPGDATVRSSFTRHAYDLMTELSVAQQPRFGRLVLDAAPTDPFADRFLGHLTDTQLAELVVRIAEHEGSHPATLARQVTADGGRHSALPSLVHEIIAATPPIAREDGAAASPLSQAVPSTPEQARQLGLRALRDYLGSRPRTDQFDAVIDAVIDRLRTDLMQGDHVMVAAVMDTLDQASGLDDTIADALRRPIEQTLDAALVGRLAASATAAGRPVHPGLLRPFGVHALVPLLSALPSLPTAAHRRLVDALVGIIPDQRDQVTELVPALPTPVVAELATIVAAIGGARMLPLLTRLADHRSPEVLDHVVAALTMQDVSAAAPLLARIAQRTDDRAIQRRCIQALTDHRTPTSRELLLTLSQASGLARRDRRRAAAAAGRGRG